MVLVLTKTGTFKDLKRNLNLDTRRSDGETLRGF